MCILTKGSRYCGHNTHNTQYTTAEMVIEELLLPWEEEAVGKAHEKKKTKYFDLETQEAQDGRSRSRSRMQAICDHMDDLPIEEDGRERLLPITNQVFGHRSNWLWN